MIFDTYNRPIMYTKLLPYNGYSYNYINNDPHTNLRDSTSDISIILKTWVSSFIKPYADIPVSATMNLYCSSITNSVTTVIKGLTDPEVLQCTLTDATSITTATINNWLTNSDVSPSLITFNQIGWYTIDYSNHAIGDLSDTSNYFMYNGSKITTRFSGLKLTSRTATPTTRATIPLRLDSSSPISNTAILTDFTTKMYKPYIKYIMDGSNRFDGDIEILISPTYYNVLKSADSYNKIFYKFKLPEINGELYRIHLMFYTNSCVNNAVLLPLRNYTGFDFNIDANGIVVQNSEINWDSSSNLATMNSTFAKLKEHGTTMEYGIVDNMNDPYLSTLFSSTDYTNLFQWLIRLRSTDSDGSGTYVKDKYLTVCVSQTEQTLTDTTTTTTQAIGSTNANYNSVKYLKAYNDATFSPKLILSISGPDPVISNISDRSGWVIAGIRATNFIHIIDNTGYGKLNMTPSFQNVAMPIITGTTSSFDVTSTTIYNISYNIINTPGIYTQSFYYTTNSYIVAKQSYTQVVTLEVLTAPSFNWSSNYKKDSTSIERIIVKNITSLPSTATLTIWDVTDDTRTKLIYNLIKSGTSITSLDSTDGTSKSSTNSKSHILTLNSDTTGLKTGYIDVTASTDVTTSTRVYVFHNVLSTPTIELDKTSISKTYIYGTSLTTETFQVWCGTNHGYAGIKYLISENLNFVSNIQNSTGSSDYTSVKNTHTITFTTTNVNYGINTGTIYIDDTAYPSAISQKSINLSFDYRRYGTIETDTTSINIYAIYHNNPNLTYTFQVWSTSDDTRFPIIYNISENISWVTSITLSNGTSYSTTDKKTHTISFDTTSLNPGDYTGFITVTDSTNGLTSKTIKLILNIMDSGIISTDKTSINILITDGTASSNVDYTSFQVWDSNDNTSNSINYSISDNVNWITDVSSNIGTSNNSSQVNTHKINYNFNLLSPINNKNIGIITLTDNNLQITTKTINIDVGIAGFLNTDTTTIYVNTSYHNNPLNSTFQVWSGSDDTRYPIKYLISENISWINSITTLDNTSYSTTDKKTHTISFDTTSLNSGDYTGIFTITDSTNGHTQKNITVILRVADTGIISTDKTSINILIKEELNGLVLSSDLTSFQVWDSNDNTSNSINYSISDNVNWIESINLSTGTSNKSTVKNTHNILYNFGLISPGNSYNGIITIRDNNLINPEKTISVNVEYLETPSIISNKNEIEITIKDPRYVENIINLSDTQFNIWDGNDDTRNYINYNISETVNWMSIYPLDGSSNSSNNIISHTITYDFSNLLPNENGYLENILISDTHLLEPNDHTSITVKINVLNMPELYLTNDSIYIEIVDDIIVSVSQDGFDLMNNVLTNTFDLNYTINYHIDWITSISPTFGILLSGSTTPNHHDIVYDFSELNNGEYSGIIYINQEYNLGKTITVYVTKSTTEIDIRNCATISTLIL